LCCKHEKISRNLIIGALLYYVAKWTVHWYSDYCGNSGLPVVETLLHIAQVANIVSKLAHLILLLLKQKYVSIQDGLKIQIQKRMGRAMVKDHCLTFAT
jgi:hypothetical protein